MASGSLMIREYKNYVALFPGGREVRERSLTAGSMMTLNGVVLLLDTVVEIVTF